MLKNSNYVDGKDGKELTRLIAEYEDITLKMKDLETEKKQIAEKIYAIATVGINETEKVVFSLIQMEGRETISLTDLKKHHEFIYEELDDLNYITCGNPYKVIRNIKHKGSRA